MASDDDAQADRNPFTQPRFLVAAAFMLGLVVMLVWLLITGGSDGSEGATEPGTTNATMTETPTSSSAGPTESPSEETPTEGPGASESSWCGLDAVELEGTLTRAPAETEWQYIGTTAVPALADHGPGVIEDNGFRHCFAQTPQGVVLAAMNYMASSDDQDAYERAVDQLLVAGPIRDQAIAEAPDRVPAPGRVTFEGFRLLSYDGTEALVDVLASSTMIDGYTSAALPMVWQEGDWRVNIRTEEEAMRIYERLNSPAGYVIWRAA